MLLEPLEDRRLLAVVNLIDNGSFENLDPSGIPGDVPGWENGPGALRSNGTPGNIIRNSSWAVDGDRTLWLVGHRSGWTLQQEVSTTADVEHTFSYWYSAGGDRGAHTKAEVFLASNLSTPIATTGFLLPGPYLPQYTRTDFVRAELTFTPTEDDIVVRFTENSRSRHFAMLDNVVLTVDNQAPTVANPIDDVMANEDQLDSVLDLTNTFSDPDAGDTLTLIASSADDSLVTATMDGNNLVLDYQLDQSGTTTVTVRATDQGGLFVEDIFTVNVASSDEQLVSLIGDVNLLRDDGVLNNGNANALTSKLENAQKKVEAGKINAAVNQLNAFRNQVEAFRNSGKLTDDQADDLLESLDALLISLLED
jgi:hypothetical protein